MKIRKSIFCFLFLLTAGSACEKALDVYVGIPFQPKNINSEYKPGLNIFGILKTGPSLDTTNHFFEVQKLIHVFDTSEILEIDGAEINLQQIGLPDIRMELRLDNIGDGRYTNQDIELQTGEIWTYECKYDTFHIRSQTRIPEKPEIQDGSLKILSEKISFNIKPDTTAYLYEVYLINDLDFHFERIIGSNENDLRLEFEFEAKEVGNLLYIFAFDKNYEKYISSSNIFYKPNAFRPRFTSVEGGYGCFCSSSSSLINF